LLLIFLSFFSSTREESDGEKEWECSKGGGLGFLGFSLLVSAKLR
jgi:hypothetical protein